MYEILFQYGPITIATFNLFLVLAFIVGIIYMVRYIQLKKLRLSFFVNHFIAFVIVPIIAGRIFYIFEHWVLFKERPLQALMFWDLGFSAFGMFYGGIGVLWWLCRKEKQDSWSWLDAFTLSGLAGLFLVHLGHFFKGSHYGLPTDLPWGIAFDSIGIPYTNPIHPTQLYSALLAFILLNYYSRKTKRIHLPGVVSTLAILIYSIGALGIDFLHGNPSTYAKISFGLIAVLAFIGYIHTSHKKLSDSSAKK